MATEFRTEEFEQGYEKGYDDGFCEGVNKLVKRIEDEMKCHDFKYIRGLAKEVTNELSNRQKHDDKESK